MRYTIVTLRIGTRDQSLLMTHVMSNEFALTLTFL